MKRIRIEHRSDQYNRGEIIQDWQTPISKNIHVSEFGDLLEKVDKRLYGHWIEGVNIFELTERQFAKLKKLLSESNNHKTVKR